MTDIETLYYARLPASATQTYQRIIDRDKRYDVRLRARARQPAVDIEVSVIISNLSRTGCKVETMMSLASKETLLLNHRDQPAIRAEIMWSKTGAYGCKFHNPISSKMLSQLIEQSSVPLWSDGQNP